MVRYGLYGACCRWFIVDVLRKSIIVLSLLVGDDDHIFTFITLLCSMVLYIAFEPFPVRTAVLRIAVLQY